MPRAAPADHDERLDPVRWQRPTRGTMLRLISVAVLLVTAAVVLWVRPVTCAPLSATPEGSTAPSGRPSASPPGPGRDAGGDADSDSGADPGQGVNPGPAAEAIPPGNVGVPIRLADPTALAVVRPGNRVDLLRVDPDRDRTTPVASAALVLRVTGADDPVTGGLLLALTPGEARQALAASSQGFAIVIRPD